MTFEPTYPGTMGNLGNWNFYDHGDDNISRYLKDMQNQECWRVRILDSYFRLLYHGYKKHIENLVHQVKWSALQK